MFRFFCVTLLLSAVFALNCYVRETDVKDKHITATELKRQNCSEESKFCLKYVEDGGDVKITFQNCSHLNDEEHMRCEKEETNTYEKDEIKYTKMCCKTDYCNKGKDSLHIIPPLLVALSVLALRSQ